MDTRECALRVARAPPPERRSADRSPTAPRRHLTSEAQQSSGTRRAIAVAVRTPVSVTAAYQPRKAGEDLLFRALQRHLETFLARAEAVDRPVPSFVERELRAYLACGIPAHGFTWLQCESCKKNLVAPFSCKGRGFCPSCPRSAMGPLLSHAAALFWLARRPKLRESSRGLFARVVHSWYRKQARAAGHNNPQYGGRVAMGVRAGRKVRKLQLGSGRERKLPPLCERPATSTCTPVFGSEHRTAPRLSASVGMSPGHL